MGRVSTTLLVSGSVHGNARDHVIHLYLDRVAQVRAIFQLADSPYIQSATAAFLAQPLVYIQPFHIIATPEDQPDTRLWMLERVYDPSMPASRAGLIIPL